MSTEREALLRQSIGGYIEPYIGLSLEELGAVRSVRVTEKGVDVSLELPIPASHYGAELAAALRRG